jgi:hypothetical protein
MAQRTIWGAWRWFFWTIWYRNVNTTGFGARDFYSIMAALLICG